MENKKFGFLYLEMRPLPPFSHVEKAYVDNITVLKLISSKIKAGETQTKILVKFGKVQEM